MTWIRIAAANQLQDDEVVAVSVQNMKLALYRIDGGYYATDNVCTHQFALLSDGYLEDGRIECPLHQARFDIRSGRALCAPATADLRTFAVKIEGADILADIG